MSEQTIDRLIRLGAKALAVGVVAVVAVYIVQRFQTTPSLADRKIGAAEATVRRNPSDTGPRIQLATMYRAVKRYDDALTQYDAVLEVEKGQATALLGRGEIFSEKGELPKAKATFEEIIKETKGREFSGVNPTLEAAYYGLASVELENGKAKAAAKNAEDAVKIEPADADAWYMAGKAELAASSYKKAVKSLQKAVLFVPTEWCDPYEALAKAYRGQRKQPFVEYATGMVELCKKDPKGAAARLERLTSGPVAVDAMLGLGMADEAMSDRQAAARWYRKVVAVDRENFNAHQGLARLGVKVGGR